MHAFLFGDSQKPLYGVYHPPKNSNSLSEKSVLLCPPIGHEYMRSHWAMCVLADKLSGSGFHCLRFDYHATGDSFGKSSEGNVSQWVEDIHTASEELTCLSGSRKTAITGLRFGATLAMSTISQGLPASDLVLWDPVISGESYLGEIQALHQQRMIHIKGYVSYLRYKRQLSKNELLGFPYSDDALSHIKQMNLMNIKIQNVEKIHMITSEKTKANTLLAEYLETDRNKTNILGVYDNPGNWSVYNEVGESLFANDIIHEIVAFLK